MWKKTELVFVTSVIIIVIGFFSAPVIIYAISDDVSTSLEQFDAENCSVDLQQNDSALDSMYSENCSNYEGVCSSYLQQLTNANTTLTTLSNNALTNEEVIMSIDNMTTNISEECSAIVKPFICQYAYPPCDGNGSPLLITQEQCVNIRDDVCASEWRIAMATESGPLDHVMAICEAYMEQPLQCHYQFKEFCGVCWPLCGSFSPFTDQSKLRQKVLIISASTLALIGGIIVFIFAIIRRSKMLVFPQVLAVYTVSGIVIIDVFILIGYIGGEENLYCSHEIFQNAIFQPSVYTQIAGFAVHFGTLFGTLTWFLHLFHLFLGLAFPFWSESLNEREWKIRLHIFEVFGSVLLCSLAPIVYVSVSDYRIVQFPPVVPLASREVSFFTSTLILTILMAAGVSLLFISFYSIKKNKGLFRKGKCAISFSVPEVKLLLLLSYFVFSGVVSLVFFTVRVTEVNRHFEDLSRYFSCNRHGYSPQCEELRDGFETQLKPELYLISNFILAFVIWVHLLFAIQVQDVRKMIQMICTAPRQTKTTTLAMH